MSSPYTSYNGYPPFYMAPPMWPPQHSSIPPTVPVDIDQLNKTQRKQLKKSIQFYRELEKALEEKAKSGKADAKKEETKITVASWLKIALWLTMCWPFVAVAQLSLAVIAIRSLLH